MKWLRPYRWLFLVFGLGLLAALVAAVAYASRTVAREEAPTRPRRFRRLGAAPLAVVVLAGALVGGAYAYDAARDDVIAPGVRVGHVHVGGLTARQAERKLRRVYAKLDRPVVVRSGAGRFRLVPRDAGVVVHVEEAVSSAIARSRRGWFLPRAMRQLAGWDVDAAVVPRVTFSELTVAAFARRVEQGIERPPRSARVVASSTGLVVEHGSDGLEVDGAELRRLLLRALTLYAAPRRFDAPARRVRSSVTMADLRRRYHVFLTVDRSRFQLRLYERLKLARTYPIAVGAIGYDTPAGLYRIQNKAVNPSWTVPYSDWTGSLAGAVIPPGPSNPLKARWLGFYGGAGIHGTDQEWSLGSAASHGCIRMAVDDVIELYDRVPVGTPIYIG